jgi:hypothetical protein
MRVKLRDAHDIATSFRQRLIDQRSPTLPLIGNFKLVILITAELSSTAFHHTYKIQMGMGDARAHILGTGTPTSSWRPKLAPMP